LHELFADQLASADLVILNKADLISAEDLARVRLEVAEELPPAVKVIEASSGRLPLDVLIGLGAGSEEHIDSRHSHHDHHHDDDDHDDHDHDAFDSISIELPQADESLLMDALTQLVVEHSILRVKGFAAIPNKPMRLLIQGVGTRFDKHFDRQWGAAEARTTRLVLIGQALDATLLEAQLRAALSV
jgi:cobalamin biosynthesis protein CobW